MEDGMQEKRTIEDILAQPKSSEELDIPQNILIDILLRLLYTEGNVDFRRMSQVMRTRMPWNSYSTGYERNTWSKYPSHRPLMGP